MPENSGERGASRHTDTQDQRGDWTPRPDPTALTDERISREVKRLEELLGIRFDHLDEMMDEKLSRIDEKFLLVEDRRREQKLDTERAVQAALDAAKEAVGKTETATDRQIGDLSSTFDTAQEGYRRELGDLKDRVTVVESVKAGGREASIDAARGISLAFAAVGVFLSILSMILVVGDVLTP